MMWIIAFSLFLMTCSSQSPNLIRYNLTDVSPLAVCNDGTPAAYYFRAGYGSGATRWIIRLQGGGWCWDKETCASRLASSRKYTTSDLCLPLINNSIGVDGSMNDGILSSDPSINPYFYNSNHVWLWYCSSDSHIGNKPANESINGWHFQGKNIVKSLITHLFKFQNPPMTTATQILLNGDSAGGVATINNMDYIGELIRPVLPNVHYRAFVDAGWFLDIPSYNNPNFSFQLVAKNLFTYWGAIYDESCVKHYGPGNEWKCFHAQYAYPYLETLTFWQEFQFDSANLGFDGVSYPFTPAEQTYTNSFQADMLKLTLNVPYFNMPNCYLHQTIDSRLYNSIKVGNYSISSAVWTWFSNTSNNPPTLRNIDACKAVGCNPTC